MPEMKGKFAGGIQISGSVPISTDKIHKVKPQATMLLTPEGIKKKHTKQHRKLTKRALFPNHFLEMLLVADRKFHSHFVEKKI